MVQSALIELVRTLQPEERLDFGQFLTNTSAGRGKTGEDQLRLFRHIHHALDTQQAQLLDRTAAFEALFPGEAWVKGKLEKVMVELHKQLRNYLQTTFYQRPENAFQLQFDLAKMYRSRGLEERYLQTLDKLDADQRQAAFKNTNFFFQQYQLEYLRHENQSFFNQKKDDLNIPAVLRPLDIYYHLNRLDLLNYFLLQRKMTNLELSEEITFALLENALPQRYLQESEILLITYKFFLLLRQDQPQPAEFQEMMALLQQHEARIEPEKLEQFFTYLRNLCVLLINAGQEAFWPTLHQIQKDNLQRGLLYHAQHQGKLTPSAFLNLVSVALHNRQLDWVRAFLDSHHDRIIGDNESADFFRLNRACYRFALGEYDAALDDIPASSTYLDYHLMARRLEIKIYYEQESELLSYKVDAFKMLISRMSKKFLSDSLRLRNANFGNLILQLMQSIPGDKERAQKLIERINSKQGVVERQWLLEKADALKKSV